MTRSLFEILKPIHDEVDASGISDEELDKLIEREIASYRSEKRDVSPPSPERQPGERFSA